MVKLLDIDEAHFGLENMIRSHQGTIHKRVVEELCSSNGIRGGLQLFKISSRGFLLSRWWTLHMKRTFYESIA